MSLPKIVWEERTIGDLYLRQVQAIFVYNMGSGHSL